MEMDTGSIMLNNPIFQPRPTHALKFTQIVADQNQSSTVCMTYNQHIVMPNRCAFFG